MGGPCAAYPASPQSPADVCSNEVLRGSQIPQKNPNLGNGAQGFWRASGLGAAIPPGIRHSQEQIKGIGAGCLPMENPSSIFSPGAVCRVLSPISISKAASMQCCLRSHSCWDLRLFLMSFPPPSWPLEQDQPGMSWPRADRHVPVAFHQLGTSGPSPAPQPSHPSHGSAREIPQPAILWAAHSCWVLWEGSFCTPEHPFFPARSEK